MKYAVTIVYRNGNTAVKTFNNVNEALALVNDTLRKWADNVTSVTVWVTILDDDF